MKRMMLVIIPVFLVGILCVGCSQKNEEKVIEMATKPMTEQFILSEMLRLLIEDNTDILVNITKGVGGGTANIHPALEKGDFDLYPEYTSTGYLYVLKKEEIVPHEQMMSELNKEYGEMGLKWIGKYGFNNTYGLVIRKEIAEQHNLKTFSDLASVSQDLIFGAEYDFYEREDGYQA
ncbi:MAG: glycine betaine ABC transporter substrate-binding protein, partial [Turicibacter sp.]